MALDAMIIAAADWLDSLDDGQRPRALLPFESERRTDWHYVPRPRPGLPLAAMDGAQRAAMWRLVATALSEPGLVQARDIVRLEGILGELTGRPDYRDPENYALILFGVPDPGMPWAWRIEGHHLSLTVTLVPGQGVAATPAFLGANPARVPDGHDHAGLRVLAAEQDLGFALLDSLEAGQRTAAVLQDRSLGDIVSGPGRETSLRVPEGVAFADLNDAQRGGLMELVEIYLGRLRADLAETERRRLRQGGAHGLRFAWAGSPAPGAPHYYRAHGPTLLIEYDNTQNGANHIHTVMHDPLDGFGADLLRRHHEAQHR